MSGRVALLDANVLYPARLRDLFLRLAIGGVYQARWTDRILDECFDNLASDRPDLPGERLDRTRRLMALAVPDAVIDDYGHLVEGFDLRDPDDRHVLAAAVAAHADVIVTANLIDFPPQAMPEGLEALSPDAFLLTLVTADADAVAAIIEDQAAALRKPPMTTSQLLDSLEAVELRRSVVALRAAML